MFSEHSLSSARTVTEDFALHRTIGDIYEAALTPDGAAILSSSLWECVSASSGTLTLNEPGSNRVRFVMGRTANFDDTTYERYNAYYCDRAPWSDQLRTLMPPLAVHASELVDPDTYMNSEFYIDLCRPIGICHMIGTLNVVREGCILAGAVYRSRREAAFGEEERVRVGLVAGHIARAIELADRLGFHEQKSAFALSLLDSLKVGVILVDAGFRTILVNAAAERTLSRGEWLSASRGRLRAVNTTQASAFDRLLNGATETGRGTGFSSGGVLRLLSREGTCLPVMVAPLRLPGSNGFSRAVAAVVLADPSAQSTTDAAAIAVAFGLTPRESVLLQALVAGRSLAEHAERVGVSINTVRTQLASIFGKTGHSRQSSLVAMAASHPVARIAGTGNASEV